PVRLVDHEHVGASDRDPGRLQVGGREPQQGSRRRWIQEALAGHRRGFDRGNSRGVLKSGEITRRGTALLPALRPRRRASSRVVPNPRGSRGSGGRTRGLPRTRREPGRAAGRRGRAPPPFPRALVGIPRTSGRPSYRLPSSLHVNVNPTVLEADREGVSLLDFRRPGDDVPVLPFRDRVSALQGREGTQQVQPAADGREVLPKPKDLARAEGRQGIVGYASARHNHDIHSVGEGREGATQTRRCTRSLDQGGRDDDVGDRIATPKDRHDIVDDRTDLRGDHTDPAWERGEGTFARGIEQAFGGQFLPRPLVRGPEGPDAGRGRRPYQQLHGPFSREHVHVARYDDVHAVLEVESQELGILAEERARDLGRRVLQREEDVARGRGLEVAHLPAHEDAAEERVRADRLADESGELRDRNRRRYARPRFPGDGDRVHHRETQTRRYEWTLGGGGRKCTDRSLRPVEQILRRKKRMESDADFCEQQLAAFLSVDDADAVLDHGPVSAEPFDRAPERATGRDDVLDEEDPVPAIQVPFELFFRPVFLRSLAHHDVRLAAGQAHRGGNRDRAQFDARDPVGVPRERRHAVRDRAQQVRSRDRPLDIYVVRGAPAAGQREGPDL